MIKLSLGLSVAYAGEGGGAPCAGTTASVIAFVCFVSGALMLIFNSDSFDDDDDDDDDNDGFIVW